MANAYSSVLQEINGDLSTHGGQLGLNYEEAITGDVDLWKSFPGGNRYIIRGNGAYKAQLPDVSATSTIGDGTCIPGYTVWVFNASGVFDLDVVNNNSITIYTLKPRNAGKFVSTLNQTIRWTLLGAMSDMPFDSSILDDITLQTGYNNTAPANPEIVLDSARRGVVIRDASTPVDEMLTLQSSGGSTYISAGTRTDVNGPGAFLEGLNGVAKNPNSVALGAVDNSGAGSIVLADQQSRYEVQEPNVMYKGFPKVYQTSGPKRLSVSQSDAVQKSVLLRDPAVEHSTYSDIVLSSGLVANTVYNFEINVIGLNNGTVNSPDGYVDWTVDGSVRPNGATHSVILARRRSTHNPTVSSSVRSRLFVSVSGGNLVMQLRAPQVPGDTNPVYSFSIHYKELAHTGLL